MAGVMAALAGILIGATGLGQLLPMPDWTLAAVTLTGFGLTALSALRLMALRQPSHAAPRGGSPAPVPDDSWAQLVWAFESFRSGRVPVLNITEQALAGERQALEKANESFQFLARRQKIIRAALDELRGELNEYYRYLTKSQVGLIGANSVAERLEKIDERLAKIRSAM